MSVADIMSQAVVLDAIKDNGPAFTVCLLFLSFAIAGVVVELRHQAKLTAPGRKLRVLKGGRS